MPIETPTTNPNATHERCTFCSKDRNKSLAHPESLGAELSKLAEQRDAITRRMAEIKAALENCATCCDNETIRAFINLRQTGMTSAKACSTLDFKPSVLHAKINQRFVKIGRRLHEPWAQDLPHRDRLMALIRDHSLATLKFSLLTDEQFKEIVTHLALPEQ